jgi:serine/threonine kinase PknH
VWLDVDLAGGQVWWDNILHQIRQSAFIAVVSRSSVRSQACLVERQYATSLGKPVPPLTVEPLNA